MFQFAAMIFFLALAVVWKRSDWLNFSIKFVFFLMAGWGAFETLKAFGYIIKP